MDETIITDDFYYDLFEGGYIKPPSNLYNEEEKNEILNAIKVIKDFKIKLEENNLIDYL